MVEKHGFFIDKGFKGSIILGEGRVYKRKIMIHGSLLVMEKLYIHYSIPPG